MIEETTIPENKNRAQYIIYCLTEMLASPASTTAANKVLEGIKRWTGLTVGAGPLGRDLNLPETYVAKILALIARQGYLAKTQYENVYKFQGSPYPLNMAAYITDHGHIIQKTGANVRSDAWRGAH